MLRLRRGVERSSIIPGFSLQISMTGKDRRVMAREPRQGGADREGREFLFGMKRGEGPDQEANRQKTPEKWQSSLGKRSSD